MRISIGIDLDNTLINYDTSMHTLAWKHGFLTSEIPKNKSSVRDHIRNLPDGEFLWQQLQADVYGPGIMNAELSEGSLEFLEKCSDLGVTIFLISHKTKFAKQDSTGTNLHQAALHWLSTHAIIDTPDLHIKRSNVFFEKTVSDKITRIRNTHCSAFIDDLEDVLLHIDFPDNTTKILYSRDPQTSSRNFSLVTDNWAKIYTHLYNQIINAR